MPEIGTSGLMSGEGKRSVAIRLKQPRPSSTLQLMRASGFRITESRFAKAIFECLEEIPDADRV